MVDIIVYTTPEKLLHKQGKLKNDDDYSETGDYYWQFYNMPKEIDRGDKIYFATKGFIRGYFVLEATDCDQVIFNCSSWKAINKEIPITHFQGFKYANKVKELNEVTTGNSSQQ